MKPDWGAAPEWAKYLAMDSDGRWCWFEDEPNARAGMWRSSNGRFSEAYYGDKWKDAKESKPE